MTIFMLYLETPLSVQVPVKPEGAVERCASEAAGRNHLRAGEGGRPKQAEEGWKDSPHVDRTEIIFRPLNCLVSNVIKLTFPGWIQEKIN